MLYIKIRNAIFIRVFRLVFRRFFDSFGDNSSVVFPLNIDGLSNISIGNNVYIGYRTWLAALPHTNEKDCFLKIGDGTCIGNFNHIYATKQIMIGKNVLTADRVYISDNLHGYEDTDSPIIHQSIVQKSVVEIGDGSWLGEGVCVIGAKIGKGCVIGANAVVTKDIPDYSVAVGIPARVIKCYNQNSQKWEKVH